VKAGIEIEAELQRLGYKAGLGQKISEASPIVNRFYGKKFNEIDGWLIPARRMHTRHKMDVFYGILFVSLIFVSASLSLAFQPNKIENPKKTEYRVTQ